MPVNIKQFWIFFFTLPLFGQVQEEVNPPDNIKSIIFKGPTEDQFPIIQLGETITLEFDDMTANEQDYYYKIIHCDYDWTPSDLLKSQYLVGSDNQRIIDYVNSYNTLKPYSHYRLRIPNIAVAPKVSGNYLIEVYNSYNELQFSRRFVVYQELVGVGVALKRSRNFDVFNAEQLVEITIRAANFQLVNPRKEVKIAVLKNYHWPTAIFNVPPQFTQGDLLEYRYADKIVFSGGNEFQNFDTSDLRRPSSRINRIEYRDIYHHYLFTDIYRSEKEYTYYPDINGDFELRTLQGQDVSREAEYSAVHFSLPYTEIIGLDEVYVFGKFNNYALEDLNRMTYNEENGNLETIIELKQGFYNYKYAIKRENGNIELNTVCGNHHFTENQYLVLVYYRNFGDLYDSIIGLGAGNSENITN
ncbi:MAG: DUF5103 domain-containing protein [Flavobacteriaceae bacterium]